MYRTIVVLGVTIAVVACQPNTTPTPTQIPTKVPTPIPTISQIEGMSVQEYIDWKVQIEKDLSETLADFTGERTDRNEILTDLDTLDVIATRIFRTPAPDRFAHSHGYLVVSAEYLNAFVDVARDVMMSEEPAQEQLDALQKNIDSFREYRQISRNLFESEIPEGSDLLGD